MKDYSLASQSFDCFVKNAPIKIDVDCWPLKINSFVLDKRKIFKDEFISLKFSENMAMKTLTVKINTNKKFEIVAPNTLELDYRKHLIKMFLETFKRELEDIVEAYHINLKED